MAAGPEDPAVPLGWAALLDVMGASESDAGVAVNERQALRLSAVQACVRVIAETLATLPLNVYQQIDGGKMQAKAHRLWPILHDEPNPMMTAVTFREAVTAQLLLWGNGYAEITRDRSGRVVALWPLPSDRTRPVRLNQKIVYETLVQPALDPFSYQISQDTPSGQPRFIDPDDVLHIPGLSFNGLVGMSPIQLARRTVGLTVAAEKFGALFFGNGSRPSGILTSPKVLRDEARRNIERSFQAATGRSEAQRAIVLEEGIKWEPMSVPPDEAQFLETRQFQIAEIARLYRVPLHMIQDLSRSTNNNIEQQSTDFVVNCLRPWAVRWEQEILRKLLGGAFFAEHDLRGLLRGDFQSRMQGYQILRNAGVISANDIRESEGWNPISEEEGGDVLLAPLNMTSLEQLAAGDADDQQAPPGSAPPAAEPPAQQPEHPNKSMQRARVVHAFSKLFGDCVGRALKRDKLTPANTRAIFSPAVTAMAEAIVAMEFPHNRSLNFEAQIMIAEHCDGIAGRGAGWAAGERSIAGQNEAALAYDLISAKLEAITEAVQ